jgi:hypothetical protein
MSRPSTSSRSAFARLLPLAAALLLLAACETTGTKGPAVEAAKPPEPPPPPMTRTQAAQECWMKTEKSAANKLDLDKRADIVDKCIDEKLKAGSAPARPPKT